MTITVTQVTFEMLDEASGARVAAIIEGEGMVVRAVPIFVRFGDVQARYVIALPAVNGVRAIFRELPADGARLEIGYADEEMTVTEFEFHRPLIA
jgi:hypothetical protein